MLPPLPEEKIIYGKSNTVEIPTNSWKTKLQDSQRFIWAHDYCWKQQEICFMHHWCFPQICSSHGGSKLRGRNSNRHDIHWMVLQIWDTECFNLLNKYKSELINWHSKTATKQKCILTSMHSFKIGDKILIANDFKTTKNSKLVPKWKGPAEIIDLNDITQKRKSAKMWKC